jgi:MarR family transcriptional regulator for hemolysin
MRRRTPPHARLDALVVTRLWAMQLAFQARLDRSLAGLGLTSAGFRLVGELMSAPHGLKQRELAQRLGIKAPTVSVAISRLEAVGVVERIDDRDDPRAWSVRLSPNAPLGPGVAVLEALERDLVGALSQKDRRALLNLLDRVTTRLSRSTS